MNYRNRAAGEPIKSQLIAFCNGTVDHKLGRGIRECVLQAKRIDSIVLIWRGKRR